MAVPKVCGIETEFGIVVKNGDPNPIAASSFLINSYLALLASERGVRTQPHVGWDFEDESPGSDARDARDTALLLSVAPEVETHLVNAVLTNGARYYVDHAHPEYSAPECADVREALIHDRAGEEILLRSMDAARRMLPDDQEIVVYKNNSDGKGSSYGCHENYLMDRNVPFGRIVHHISVHLVTRQIYTGAGKVGSESPGSRTDEVPFQITQRADFFEEEVGLETTLKRPIVNTRDEPHADPRRYRRFHVIAGDANMSETATYLKLGTTAAVLAMIEDDVLDSSIRLAHPIPAMHAVSRDLTLTRTLELDDGRRMSALDIQWALLGSARDHFERGGLDVLNGEVAADIISLWESVLTGMESDPLQLADQLDWVAKYRLFEAYRERHGIDWDHARLVAMDLQYHDLRPGSSLARRVGLKQVVDPAEVERAISQPPDDTRAYFRGRCLDRFPGDIVTANWDSVVFDVGESALRRVPMMEPLKGTKEHVGSLFDEVDSAAELLDRLGN